MGHRNPVIEIVEMSALYRTTQQPFNATHHASIIVGRQGKGVAGASGATGPADAVNIGLGSVRDIIVDHMGYLGNIDTAGSDISGYQDMEGAVPETIQSCLAPVLGQVALQRSRAITGLAQLFPQALGTMLRAGEDQHGFGIGVSQQLHQHGRLEMLGHRIEGMTDRFDRSCATHFDGNRLRERFHR